jgi:nitrite reductase (NADH) large subunit
MANKLKVVGMELASAGEIDVENRYESKIEETETTYKKIVIEGKHIIGCIMIGDTSNFHVVTKAISEKTDIENVKI